MKHAITNLMGSKNILSSHTIFPSCYLPSSVKVAQLFSFSTIHSDLLTENISLTVPILDVLSSLRLDLQLLSKVGKDSALTFSSPCQLVIAWEKSYVMKISF